MTEVVIIVAVASNRTIGRNNELPWRLPEDLRRFKQLTMGHPIVMGRRTWDSLPRQPLPGRTNIVVTRDPDFRAEQALVAGSIQDALQAAERAPGSDAVFVIGGAQVYAQALPLARRLEVTEVHQAVDGDVFLPPIDPDQWREVSREPHTAADGLAFDFVRYERRA